LEKFFKRGIGVLKMRKHPTGKERIEEMLEYLGEALSSFLDNHPPPGKEESLENGFEDPGIYAGLILGTAAADFFVTIAEHFNMPRDIAQRIFDKLWVAHIGNEEDKEDENDPSLTFPPGIVN
jgi:hypothetical protein